MTDSSRNATVIGDRGSPPPPPPPDELPAPGGVPIGSRLPFLRNALFTGRVEELKELARVLLHDRSPAALVTQVTHGMGGVGKTQLAVEFAHRYGRYFHGVHWIHAAQLDRIDEEIAACGEAMALSEWPKDTHEQAARTLREWKSSGPRLVILDNFLDTQKGADGAKTARKCLSRFGGGQLRLLLTTRWTNWPLGMGLAALPLNAFTSGESLDFLRRYLPADRVTDAELEALAERLGHLPLALELAGRYLKSSSETLATYENTLDRLGIALKHPSLQGWLKERGSSPTNHDLNLITTFAASWNQVKNQENGQESCYLFLMAGHCAPNVPISHEFLWQAARNADISEQVYNQALTTLTNLSLLHKEERDSVTIHPLLAEYAQLIVEAWDMILDILDALAQALAKQTYRANEAEHPDQFLPLDPHSKVVADAAEKAGLEKAGTLWNNLGYHQQMVAAYGEAESAFERAIEEVLTRLERHE